MAAGFNRIELLSDSRSFVDPDYPPLVELDEIEAIFTKNQNLIIAFVPADGSVFSARSIETIQQLTRAAWQLPYASRVDSISNYQYTEADGDDLSVGDLLPDYGEITPELIARARRVARTEPAIHKNLVSESGDVAVVNINFEVPDDMGVAGRNEKIALAAQALVEEFSQRFPGTHYYLAGVLPLDYSLGKYGKRDGALLTVAMLVVMALILFGMSRSVAAVFGATMVVICSTVITLGFLGWNDWQFDPGSAISPVIIVTLAVADSIHLILGVNKGLLQGTPRNDAIIASVSDNLLPVFLTSLTTVMGMGTFVFAEHISLRRIGLCVSLGVGIAFLLSVTLLPALLSLLPMKPQNKTVHEPDVMRLATVINRYYRLISVTALIAGFGVSALMLRNSFNDSPQSMLASYTPERQAFEFLEKNVSGVMKIDLALFGDGPGAVSDPKILADLEQLTTWLRSHPHIDHVSSITDTLKRLNQNLHGDDESWYKLPESKELAAQYLLLYEMSLPVGLDLNNQLNVDKSGTRITITFSQANSQTIVEQKRAIEDWVANNSPELRLVVTGHIIVMAQLSYVEMIPAMMKGGVLAVLMVSCVLFIALRSLKLGFLGMLMNMLPMSIGYGIWYLLNGQVSFAVAAVAGVCLGVVVDFAVHLLTRYQRSRNQMRAADEAIVDAYKKTGRPLCITAVVLVSGFWLLMLSPITLNAHLGFLTGVIILLALAYDLVVLPSLLIWLDGPNNRDAAV